MENIHEKLKLLQGISGKTQSELASDLKVTTLAYSNWWTGKSIPRKSAQLRIDKLVSSYGLETKSGEENSTVTYKKNVLLDLNSKHNNIIKKIIERKDLIDELSLSITYNSNAIEGSTLTIEDTARVIFNYETLGNKTLNEQLEAKNHDKAFRFVLQTIYQKTPINEVFTKKIHSILMAGIRDDAGYYRTHPVRIVGSYVPTANYIKIPELMRSLFFNKNTKDTLKYISKFHADFEKIHPFSDGNGRVGRLILIAMLLKYNFAPAIITRKKRPLYYKVLQKAQLNDEYEPLEDFIHDAVILGYRIIKE